MLRKIVLGFKLEILLLENEYFDIPAWRGSSFI
jgi:hypothetical protein